MTEIDQRSAEEKRGFMMNAPIIDHFNISVSYLANLSPRVQPELFAKATSNIFVSELCLFSSISVCSSKSIAFDNSIPPYISYTQHVRLRR